MGTDAFDAACRRMAETTPGLDLRPGAYLFATVHRFGIANLTRFRSWAALLGRVAREDRPVILAIHPGTRLALEQGGDPVSPDVRRSVDPPGYRTSLTLKMHAAAVIADSGGIQREAAWLGVPCLVLRAAPRSGSKPLLPPAGG